MKKNVLLVLIIIGLIITIILIWPVKFKHRKGITALVFSPDDSIIAFGSADKTIRLWNVATGKQIIKIKEDVGTTQKIIFIDDGKTLVAGGWGGPVCFWDVRTGVRKFELPHQGIACIGTIAIPSKEDFIITTNPTLNWPYLTVWDMATRKKRYEIKGNDKQIKSVSISCDGMVFATAGYDDSIRLFNTESGKEKYKHRYETHSFSLGVEFSPFENIAAFSGEILTNSATNNNTNKVLPISKTRLDILIWDVNKQKEVFRIEGTPSFEAMAFLPPDGKKLVTLSTTIRVYDLNTAKEILYFALLTKGNINAYAVSNNGNIVATGDDDGYIQLWDIKTGKEIK